MAARGAWDFELVAGAGADVAADVEPVGVEDGRRFYGGGRLIPCRVCLVPITETSGEVLQGMCGRCYVSFGK